MELGGVRGDNRLDFRGRIRRQAVQPGVYVLTLTGASSRKHVAQPLLVQVVSPRRTIVLDDAPKPGATCGLASASSPDGSRAVATRLASLLATPFDAPSPVSRSTRAGSAPAAEPETSARPRKKRSGVLGAGVSALPQPTALAPAQGSWLAAAVFMLLLLGLPILGIALAVRHFRGRESPAPGS